MPRTGRPPKPIEEKQRIGTLRKDRLPANTSLALVPAIEPGLFELEPHEAMEAVLENGVRWLAATDAIAMALLRESLEERRRLREFAQDVGGVLLRKDLRELDKQIISQLSLLGFDPAARARLGLAEVKAQSTLEALRSSRQAKILNQDDGERAP